MSAAVAREPAPASNESSSHAELRWLCPECAGDLAAKGAALSCPACGWRIEPDGGVWPMTPDFIPPGFEPARRDHLADIETDHFWFPARRRLLQRILDDHGGACGRAIDLGCGNGTFLTQLAARAESVVGVDAYRASLATARTHLPNATMIQGNACRVPLADAQFDLAVCLDVLEHVPPAPLLDEAHRLLRPDGRLLITVPAAPSLWSDLDRSMGHRCRYRAGQLVDELSSSGFTPLHVTHYQFLLFPLLWIARRLPPRRLQRVERHPPRWLGRLLGAVNAAEVHGLGRHRLGWGSSLVVLARRTT